MAIGLLITQEMCNKIDMFEGNLLKLIQSTSSLATFGSLQS